MKKKDSPLVKARKFAERNYRAFMRMADNHSVPVCVDGRVGIGVAKDWMSEAYMAGYRHGRKAGKESR